MVKYARDPVNGAKAAKVCLSSLDTSNRYEGRSDPIHTAADVKSHFPWIIGIAHHHQIINWS